MTQPGQPHAMTPNLKRHIASLMRAGTAEALEQVSAIERIVSSMQQMLTIASQKLSGAELAEYVHAEVDRAIDSLSQKLNSQASCKRGCAACCNMEIPVTREEAELLARELQAGAKHSAERFAAQQQWPSDASYWQKQAAEKKGSARCMWLKGNGECGIYKHRPSACRLHYVRSHPDNCRIGLGIKEVDMLTIVEGEAIFSALLAVTSEMGSMPALSAQVLAENATKAQQPA